MRTCPAAPPRRSARRRSCSADSSPETYSVGTPACSRRAEHWSSSVDLPMPGSPPTITMEPGTTPPPSTKSNSLRPVCHRLKPSAATSARRTGARAGWLDFLPRPPRPPDRPTASSATVFPAPHSVQGYTERWLEGIGALGLALGVVVEAGVLLVEGELEGPRRAVAVLCQVDFRHALLEVLVPFFERGVHLRAIDEDHQVGVLLDGAGVAAG